MRPDAGIRGTWDAMRADPDRARKLASARAERAQPPRPVVVNVAPASPPPRMRETPHGTGGHRPTMAERRAVYAMFTARRGSVRGLAGRPGVFASMRDPDQVTPLERWIFGAGG